MKPRYGSLRVSGSKPDEMRRMIVCSIERMSTRPPRYKYRLSRSPARWRGRGGGAGVDGSGWWPCVRTRTDAPPPARGPTGKHPLRRECLFSAGRGRTVPVLLRRPLPRPATPRGVDGPRRVIGALQRIQQRQ
eukprot:7126305-Prymnesium_polylepis.1